MNYKDKVKAIFLYLLNVKNLNENIIRNIWDYPKLYWESELLKAIGCSVNKSDSKEWWLKVNKKCKRLYDPFLKLYLESDKREENSEILWGHGLMVWKFNGHKIVHPILTTKMKLSFDSQNEAFILVPEKTTVMEINIFEGMDIPNLKDILQLENRINNSILDPRNIEHTEKFLTEVVSYLSADGRVAKENLCINKIALLDEPVIYDSPMIFIRKNNTRLWQRELNDIITAIDKGYPIPETVKAIVKEEKIEQSQQHSQEWARIREDLYFPLAANHQQKEIIKKISENYGVVVQGAPGTGKSHTIINLISHLLAHGKRVLVTSEKKMALKVLVEKIPDEIKPLCLSVLGDDSNSIAELDESVKKIIDNMSQDPEKLHEEIERLESELKACRKNQHLLCVKFKEIEKIENQNIRFEGQQYKIVDVAKWVKENENKYSWIEDEIRLSQHRPLSESEFEKLICLLKEVNRDYSENLKNMNVMLGKLPSSTEICNCVYRFKELGKNYETYIQAADKWRIPDNNRCNYDKLLNLLEECKCKMEELDKGIFIKILEKYYGNKIVRESLNDAARKSNDYILMLGKIKSELRTHKIQVPPNSKFNKDFYTLFEKLSSRGKIGRLFKFIHPEYNYIFKECKVDGRTLETLGQASIVKLYLQEKSIFKELKDLWNNIIKGYGGNLVLDEDKELSLITIQDYVKKLSLIVNWDRNYKSRIVLMLGRISAPANIDWHRKDTYDYAIESVKCIKKIEEHRDLKAYIEVLKKIILANDRVNELREAIEELNINKIKIALNKMEGFYRIKNKALELEYLINKLRKICPLTVEKILDKWEMADESYKDWKNAWRWAKWNSLLKKVCNANLDLIELSMKEEKRKERVIIKQVIFKKACYNQIIRTTEREKRSLCSWLQAIKRIEDGSGKMVSEYKKIAQNEMENCKEAISVCIMPLNKVIENIRISQNLFDVVIFDESSQSDIFSICALMRAKKAVIVGDDKQIDIEPARIDSGLIQGLINKHLKDIPQRDWFDLQASLYETTLRVFPNRLILKEHFRCLPEIIDFTNETFYFNEIKELRYPKSHEEFYPSIVPVRVNGGYQEENKAINVPEAEFLVKKLVDCCKDKRYSGMTMGVISLLGEQQSRLIESMIRERIGEEEIIKRKIVCGDSYAFQGDERDIMFLSMVVSRDVKLASSTRESERRMFNVATSRARNQMWVFYSIDLQDISPECIRYSLLKHCLNYKKKNNRYRKVQLTFMSKFQRDIYELMKSKGYSVEYDIKLGQYKIDFIIEGQNNRVAVICNGDIDAEKHNWQESIERKLELEKLGWKFFRIRMSEFYYSQEKTIERLWNELEERREDKYRSDELIVKSLKVV